MEGISKSPSTCQNVGGALKVDSSLQNEQVGSLPTDREKTSFGKFENANELLKAYNNLEVQFTKRSQELKRLQRENSSSANEQALEVEHSNDSDNCAESHAIQDETGSVAKARTEENASCTADCEDDKIADEVKNFLKIHPNARYYAQAIANKVESNQNLEKGFLERAYIQVLTDELSAQKSMINEDFMYEKMKDFPLVKERLIREYLEDTSRGTCAKLISSTGESVVMPPKKPTSIYEAGVMAQKILRKK